MIGDEYLRYAKRGRGLDHDWFSYQPPAMRPRLRWPASTQVALWITVPLEVFPLSGSNAPFRPTGALDRPYPDFWGYAARDYGLRVGIFRLLKALDRYGICATAAVNAEVARRAPDLIKSLLMRDWEIMGSGINMATLHHGGLDKADEAQQISQALDVLRPMCGDIVGWHSPGHSQSAHTMELLAGQGIRYVADWVNDDLPYDFHTANGDVVAMPLSYELADRTVLLEHDRTIDEYTAMVTAAARRFQLEASNEARILSISVSPWIIGYPHRIAAFEQLLEDLVMDGRVWIARGRDIFQSYQSQMSKSDSVAEA
ncbi:MAG: polysaccharide deacetylase family protein [Proteobacteria bacterium]|nr:polysaccharide deacetylase family protein [Pseudomonadota bacterium]